MTFSLHDASQLDFRSEADCVGYLMKKRWSGGFCCPNCDNDTFYKIQTRNLLECKECRVQISLTAGTIMHKSKLSLLVWFRAIQILIQDGHRHTVTSFAELMGINYRTAKLLIAKVALALQKEQLRFDKSVQQHKTDQVTKSTKRKQKISYFLKNNAEAFPKQYQFAKWMKAFLSVRLYPVFLKCYHRLN
ncbi:IS1595 family transposase [Paenibacillus aestuarii]|uniref:Transposase n=1 Tax=Paenibacillus aestuarii TaxID=516965 RepID=A0ABW0K987_9BACL|nr:IS1595 family transposase [Paenibacillus aestuarii]